jgi:GDP-L-fucose synthase
MDKNMKIVVTGGSGLVGNHLKKIMPGAIFLSSKDYNLVLESEVIRLYKELDPDYVVHLAARVGGIIDNINHPLEYFEDNVLMNTLMVKYARLNRVKRFLGVLSSCIFPDTVDEYPMKEEVLHDGPPTKTNFSYGMAKRSLAVQIDTCNEQYGTNYSYISPCNLYGESDKDDENRSHFVTALIKKIFEANKNNEDHITLYGNGEPLRQFIHANDIANIIKIIIDRDITESFNLATEENITINQIAEIALEATDSNLEIRYDKSKPNGQYRKDLDITKFRKLIPDYKFITLEEGIRSHYNTYKNEL